MKRGSRSWKKYKVSRWKWRKKKMKESKAKKAQRKARS
jgi:hypothetical protein